VVTGYHPFESGSVGFYRVIEKFLYFCPK